MYASLFFTAAVAFSCWPLVAVVAAWGWHERGYRRHCRLLAEKALSQRK